MSAAVQDLDATDPQPPVPPTYPSGWDRLMDATHALDLTVLIVEDDLALLAFLVTRLEYEPDIKVVGYATDGAEALRLAEELQPDVVLSDFDLPDMDGLTVVGSLRELLPMSGLVLYTAAWSPSLERSARLRGADDCLDKTIAPAEVVAALRASVSTRRTTAVA